MAKFDLDNYEMVDVRLAKFWADHPNGRVLTEMVFQDERRFIVKAEIYFDREDMTPVAHGHAEEIVGASPVNRTSALENCETSAIGRALANCNYAPVGKRPSREEMEKVQRYDSEPRKAPKPKKEFSAEVLEKAQKILPTIATIESVDELREIWKSAGEFLDAPISGTTLKDVINKRVEELAAVK
jgi:hypothetical protein